MTTRWEQAVAVRPTDSAGRWAADVAPGFSIGGKTNGGYLMALAAQAAAREVERSGEPTKTLSP